MNGASGCEAWREALLDSTSGQTPGPGFEEHLSACRPCQKGLAVWQERGTRLDAGLRNLLDLSPSPSFSSRVLERVGPRQRDLPVWRRATVWGAAAAVFMVISIFSVRRSQEVRALKAAQQLASWHSPTEGLLNPPGHSVLTSIPRVGESFLDKGVRSE